MIIPLKRTYILTQGRRCTARCLFDTCQPVFEGVAFMRFCLLLRGYRGEAATFNKTYCARQPVSTPHIWFYGGKRAAALPFTNFVMLEQPAVRSIAVFLFFWEFHLYGTIRRFKNFFFYVVSLGCCFLSLIYFYVFLFFPLKGWTNESVCESQTPSNGGVCQRYRHWHTGKGRKKEIKKVRCYNLFTNVKRRKGHPGRDSEVEYFWM